MLKFKINDAKSQFFDRPAVEKKLAAGTRRALSKIGAFIRRTAKGLLRKGKASAKPGTPPKMHGEQLLKRYLYFAFDPQARSVVIGPALLNQRDNPPTPGLLEAGGPALRRIMVRAGDVPFATTLSVREYERRGKPKTLKDKTGKRKKVRIVAPRWAKAIRVTYSPHPYMGPALEKNKQHIPAAFREILG